MTDALFLTKYGKKGASSRYRFLQYFPHLEDKGIRCTQKPLFSDEYLEKLYETGKKPTYHIFQSYVSRLWSLTRSRAYDVIIIEKELLPYLPATIERLLSRVGTPYIVDHDDAIFHNYDLADCQLVRKLLGNKIDIVMREADLVVAGNEYIASRARTAGARKVETIPTVINLDKYPHSRPDTSGEFTIGWIGSPATSHYLKGIAPALRKVCEKRNARVVLVGSGPIEITGVQVKTREWSDETEIEDIASFDVGIMPLSNGPWERGKCGFKLIQYMGCGKPVVASPVGMNTQIVEEGRNGYLAEDNEDWFKRLCQLADSAALASLFGKAGRKKVEREYCLEVTAPRWEKLISDVISGN